MQEDLSQDPGGGGSGGRRGSRDTRRAEAVAARHSMAQHAAPPSSSCSNRVPVSISQPTLYLRGSTPPSQSHRHYLPTRLHFRLIYQPQFPIHHILASTTLAALIHTSNSSSQTIPIAFIAFYRSRPLSHSSPIPPSCGGFKTCLTPLPPSNFP